MMKGGSMVQWMNLFSDSFCLETCSYIPTRTSPSSWMHAHKNILASILHFRTKHFLLYQIVPKTLCGQRMFPPTNTTIQHNRKRIVDTETNIRTGVFLK